MKTTIIKAIIALGTIAFAAGTAEAQQTVTSETDSGTSAAISKGSHPLGSYSASGFDSVNLFNGGTNMTFPLASLDGRGGLGASVSMSYNSKFWRSQDLGPMDGSLHHYDATYADWDSGPSLAPGWRVHFGYMKIRHSGWEQDTGPGGCTFFHHTTTKITFVAPDGTEYDFRDDLYDGAPGTMGGCGQPGLYRGTTFHTADGSAATFVSDVAISDQPDIAARVANGVVYLRDGTRFRIIDSYVVWRQDRNGNRVNFVYEYADRAYPYTTRTYEQWLASPSTIAVQGDPTRVIDTLGRQIVLTHYNPGQSGGLLLEVTYPGYNGTTHTIEVRAERLTDALHPDFWDSPDQPGPGPDTPMYEEIWQGVPLIETEGPFNPFVVTSIELPSGHTWMFEYNRHGEVAKTTLPSGGAVRYDMTAGAGTTTAVAGPALFRYCAKRSTFVNASDAIEEGSTRYSDPSSNNGAVVSTLDVFEDRWDHGTHVSRTIHTFSGGPLNSYFGYRTTELEHTGYSPWLEGRELETLERGYPNGVATDRSKVKITWEQRPLRSGEPFPWGTVSSPNVPSHDTRVKVQQTQLREVASPYPTSEVTYAYDDVAGFNNVKQERTYDFGPGSRGPLLRQVDRVYETSQLYTSVGPHLRSLVKSESVGDGSNIESTTVTEYDVYDSSSHHAPLLDRTFAPSVASSRGANFGTSYTTRGNPTKVTSAANDVPANQPRTYFQYDIAGNAVVAFSPRVDEAGAVEDRHKLEVTFDPAFHFAYPTSTQRRVSRADNAPTPTTLETQTWYDFSTGLVKQVTGYNGEVTTLDYELSANGLDRLLTVTRPVGAGAGGYGTTTYSYSSPGGNQWVQEVSDVTASTSVLKKTTYDGLMRPFYNESTNPNGSGLVSVTTRYDGLGRAIKSSNPLASAAASTDGWTVTVYDDQDRPLTVTTYDGRSEPPGTPVTGVVTSQYAGQMTTVTDQAGVARKSTTDALGRAKSVVEDPTGVSYTTSYGYDARSNLKVVTQGAQTRLFEYDKVGRLTKATMPECGSTASGGFTTYMYDLGSNIKSQTDPRGIITTSGYDEMNRLRWVQYSNTTNTNDPLKDVSYFYDDSAPSSSEISSLTQLLPPSFDRGFALGRLVGVVTNADVNTAQERTGVFYSYERGGRVSSTAQLTDGVHYTSTIPSYNLASQPTQLGYPSGSSVTLGYNAAGSLSSVIRNAATLSSSIQYAPIGSMTQQTLGNGLVHSVVYNSRVQPTTIGLGSSAVSHDKLKLEYDYGNWTPSSSAPGSGPLPDQDKNNGNVGRIRITPGSGSQVITQCFDYDNLNRLLIAREFGETSGGGAVPPTPPTNLVATAISSSQINLTWSNGTGQTSLIVERRTPDTAFTTVATLGAAITSWSNVGLEGGKRYWYRIRATNAGGSAYSNEADATTFTGTGPNAPALVSAIPSNQTVTLSWTSVPNATGYKIFYATSSSGPYSQFGGIVGGLSNAVFPLVNGTTYYFYVKAVVGGNDTNPSNVLSATPADIPPPAAPSNVVASAYSSTQANVAWRDNSSDETAFEVWRSSNGYSYALAGTTPPDTISFADANLTPGTTYTYYVRAIKNGIPSGVAKPFVTTTTYVNGAKPTTPGNLVAAAISQTRIKLTWVDGTNETGYLVFRQSDRLPLLLLGSVSADVTQFVDNQAQADSSYTYVVYAINSSSVLSLPAIASATTFGAGEDIPGSDTIGVFWPASSGWFLRNSNTTGIADIQFSFGPMPSTWNSITGDWDGDGDDTAGLYDPATGSFFLKNTNDGTGSDISFTFGAGGQGYIPIVGDWDGNGVDSIGLYDPASSAFLLRNANSAGDADAVFYFGAGGLGYVPIAGDWNGDGTDTVGIYLGSAGAFFLRNANEGGGADLSFSFGAVNSAPIAGDWDGDGVDTIGTYVAASGSFFLRNQNSSGNADASLSFGPAGAKPLAGDWDDSALKTAAGGCDNGGDVSDGGDGDGNGRNGRRGRRGRNGADKTAVAGVGWTEQYAYDRYGNRTDGPGMVSEKNQFVRTASGPGYNYDDAGNLTKAPDGTAFDTYSYDARNMLFQAVANNGSTTVTTKFVYDGAGRRVKKIVTGGATTRFVYGAGGGLIAEYVNGTLSKEYVGGPVGMLAVVDVPAAKVNYLTPDHLGTPRIVTSNTGATATVVSRHDYRPFGAEIFADGTRRTTGMGYPVNPQSDTIRQQFTGYERDTETLLDFAQARYYGGNQGRFTTMDPLLQSGSPGDPQSWNRYTYGLNNPLRYTDPTGLYSGDAHLAYPHGEMVLAVDDSGANLNSGKIAQAGGSASSDVKAANGVILAVKAEDGSLTVYVGGINNGSQKKTANSRDAAVALLGSDGAVSISNDHTFVQAIIGRSNGESAQAFADVIQAAIDSGISPGKISVVAHSNGVPTLAAGLKLLTGRASTATFSSVALVAPNTRSVDTVRGIAERFEVAELAQSTRDLALFFAKPFGSRSVGSWAKKLAGTGIGVVATRQFNHSFKAYAKELNADKFKVLLSR